MTERKGRVGTDLQVRTYRYVSTDTYVRIGSIRTQRDQEIKQQKKEISAKAGPKGRAIRPDRRVGPVGKVLLDQLEIKVLQQ